MINAHSLSLDAALVLVEKEIENAIKRSPSVVRKYIAHLLGAKGKMIRAKAILICAQDDEGLISENAVKGAAAVEILHVATLVHDDVIDDADIRRGIPTLQKKYGRKAAVICGDYLLSLALKMMTSIPDKREYLEVIMPDYVGKICSGELYQFINNGNVHLTVYQYLKIIAGKTAALFEASFYAGAVFSGCDRSQYKHYCKIGKYIGMIFQLNDDCMDLEVTEDVAKKPVMADFQRDIITLPLIHAFRKLPAFLEKAKNGKLSEQEIKQAVEESDGLNYTRMVGKKYFHKAAQLIETLEAGQKKKEQLMWILQKASQAI